MPKPNTMSSDYTDIPAIPPGLVEALLKRFPDRCPKLSESEREIWLYTGQVNLIKFLKSIQEKRNNSVNMENVTRV